MRDDDDDSGNDVDNNNNNIVVVLTIIMIMINNNNSGWTDADMRNSTVEDKLFMFDQNGTLSFKVVGFFMHCLPDLVN